MSIVKSHMSNVSFVFFGTPDLSVEILDHLKRAGFIPSLVVTNPDRPQGRNLLVTPPPTKLWAIANDIPFLQPENLSDPVLLRQLSTSKFQLFVVVAYGKIIPKAILELPEKGTLNIHYSLLPKYRGASPIETAILADDQNTGVTIMLMDEKMDHGPIVAQRALQITNHKSQIPDKTQTTNPSIQTPKQLEWPMKASELRKICNLLGAELLTETIPLWVEGKIKPSEQDHGKATYAPKIEKENGLIDLAGDPYKNFLKFQAYENWPGVYFLAGKDGKKNRIIVKTARFEDGKFIITRVIPEGKKEISYNEFLRGSGTREKSNA